MRARRKCAPPTLLPSPAARSARLKPELQEVVLCSILSGRTNYSPPDQCALLFCIFFRLPTDMNFFDPPLPTPAPPSSRLISCCDSSSSGGRQKGSLPALSQNDSHSEAKGAAAALAQPTPRPPKFRENIPPAVFPQDLWYSCPQYPHLAAAEFPQRMKSRIISSL